MSGTTPRFAFPFPTGTDRVADGDNAMQALATAVEQMMSTKAVIALGGGAAAMDPDGLSVWIMPGFVLFRVFASNTGALAADTTVAALPPSAYPQVRALAPAIQLAPTVAAQGIEVGTDGVVKIKAASPGGGIWAAQFSYALKTHA